MKPRIVTLRKQDEIIIWPVYFDSTKTRAEGRKVSKKLGKSSVTLTVIEKALRSLRYPHKLVPEAAHPHLPWKQTGLILVKKVKTKNQILKDAARELNKFFV